MSNLRFYPLEADGSDYPRSVIPLFAQPSLPGWFRRRALTEGSAFLNDGESFASGRYALAEAMRRVGVGPGQVVLFPAFHCRALVEPAVYLGSEPRFYPVNPDLRPDFTALSALIDTGTAPVAMVLTHYFGFPNALEEAEHFCRKHGIALIEDCAHALYGQDGGGRLLGSVGDYAAASLWKFLPVRDGAVLLDNVGTKPRRRLETPPLSAEVKGLAGLTESWIKRVLNKPPPVLDASLIAAEADRIAAKRLVRTPELGLKEFSPGLSAVTALRCSRRLAAAADHGYVVSRRRDHYLRWLEGMRGVSGAIALFPELPEGIVPYAFPLLLESPGTDFHRLKTAGVPFWRWEDMAMTDCPTSIDYRLRLLQLPCHQGLKPLELEWMIRAVQILIAEGRV